MKPIKQPSSKNIDCNLLLTIGDRFGVSNTSSAEVIDKTQIRWKRAKKRKRTVKQTKIFEVPTSYFDGRKDKTLSVSKRVWKK